MRGLCLVFACLVLASAAEAAEGRVIKVLPQFLDLKGRNTVAPSLYDRDAYQASLRKHPAQQSGMSFQVEWEGKAPAPAQLKLRLQLRGEAHGDVPKETVIEEAVQPTGWLGRWTALTLKGAAYHDFGEVTAWRVTLWNGTELLGEQKSFLW